MRPPLILLGQPVTGNFPDLIIKEVQEGGPWQPPALILKVALNQVKKEHLASFRLFPSRARKIMDASPKPADANMEFQRRSLSRWSVASLVLSALAILLFLLPPLAIPRYAAGPAEAAALLLQVIFCFVAAWLCALLGVIAGWIGLRRSGRKLGFAWVGLLLNGGLCLLEMVLAILTYFFDVEAFPN